MGRQYPRVPEADNSVAAPIPLVERKRGRLIYLPTCSHIVLRAQPIHLFAPLLIGFILGPPLENNFARAMQLFDGMSFIWGHPMTLPLLVVAALLIVFSSYRSRRAISIADGD